MESLIFMFLSVFIIYCLIQISILLQQFLVNDAYLVKSFVVVILSGKIKNVEFVIRKSVLKYRLDGGTQVIFVDDGLDSENKLICEKFCNSHAGVVFCSYSQLFNTLQMNLKV